MEYAGCGITDGRNNCFLGFFFFVDYFFVVFALIWTQILPNYY